MSASSHTRGHRFAPEFTQQVIKWLELHGRKVFNGSSAIDIEISKVKQYLLLEAAGIAHPKTVAVLGAENLAAASQNLQFPVLTKHNRAGKGLGIHQFDDVESLAAYAASPDFEESADGITLLQEYIQSKNQHVHRSEFVAGKFLYTVAIDTASENGGKSKFELCPADECVVPWARSENESENSASSSNFELDLAGDNVVTTTASKFQIIEPLPLDEKTRYEEFLKANQLDIVAMEWIEDAAGQKYVYDINTNTNYNSTAEDAANIHAHERIAEFLKTELEKLQ